MKANEQFKRLSQSWLEHRPMSVVPVIGSGVNIQAEIMNGGSHFLDWSKLMTDIIGKVDLPQSDFPDLPNSFIAKWESILRFVTVKTTGAHPFLTEKALQKEVQKILKIHEDQCKDYSLFKLISQAGFQDVISLNFDRCIALSNDEKSIKVLTESKGSKDEITLYRHSAIDRVYGDLRVWYPHGDTKRFETIKLGIRKYGLYIGHIERLRGMYMKRWFYEDELYTRVKGGPWIPPLEWDRIVRTWDDPGSWVNIFKSAPLLFIGCGLHTDEWPLWFLLNQRARQTAFLDQKGSNDSRPDTVVLTAGKDVVSHLINEPEYITNIHFDSYDDLWNSVIVFLEEGKKVCGY